MCYRPLVPADTLNISLSGPLAEDLRAAADACEMPVEDFVRTVLRREAAEAAEALGWNADIAEDLAALKDYDETGMAIPWEEVEPWLQSLTTDNPLPRPQPRKLK